jgi:hypothetical protein
MRSQSPSLAPDRQANDVTVHIVMDDLGSFGRAYVETDAASADERPSLRTSSQANIQTASGRRVQHR